MLPEFKSILDLIQKFPTEQSCIDHVEVIRWNGNVISPFDPTSKVYKCANNKYRCKNTGKYFNAKVGTIFENTNIPLQKWFLALYVFSSHKKGISSHQLARDIDVTQKSAWFMLHRLRYAFNHPNFQQVMSSEVEIDETYIGGEYKNKHTSKKKEKATGRSLVDKAPVVAIKGREGYIVAMQVSDTKQSTIEPLVEAYVEAGSTVYTDEWHAYNNLHQKYEHHRVNHGAKQFVNHMAHTNGVENFWSHLKRGIDGIYHWVSKDHLDTYVQEFTLRYNTRKFGTASRFNLILGNVTGRLTYKTLIA